MLHVAQEKAIRFQWAALTYGQYARHARDMSTDSDGCDHETMAVGQLIVAVIETGKSYEEENWAKLSPMFRRAHNRLRQMRGLSPIPAPKIDLWVPPPSEIRTIPPDDPECVQAAREFLGGAQLMGGGTERFADYDTAAPEWIDPNSEDAEFLAWTRANAAACGHEVMAKALADTHLCRRPRLLRTEFWYAQIRALVRSKSKPWGRFDARDHLRASDRAIGRALAPAPAAPPLTEERLRKILVDNLEIAERSGNRAAVELLRRQLKRLETARPVTSVIFRTQFAPAK
jgi:hypothetical protein